MKEGKTAQSISVNGITIAPGVVETIVSLATAEVDGVAGVGTAGTISTIVSAFRAGKAIPTAGVDLSVNEEDQTISVDITIQVFYGYRIAEVAANVRKAIADAICGQIGVNVSSVDVYVDALQFEE